MADKPGFFSRGEILKCQFEIWMLKVAWRDQIGLPSADQIRMEC